MPKGPQGQKRPADAIARAIMVAKIATGELSEGKGGDQFNHLSKAGEKGGLMRARKLGKEETARIAAHAAKVRWKKHEKPEGR